MAYRIAAIPITLSDFRGHSPIASLSKCFFCTAVQQLTRFQLTLRATRYLWETETAEFLVCFVVSELTLWQNKKLLVMLLISCMFMLYSISCIFTHAGIAASVGSGYCVQSRLSVCLFVRVLTGKLSTPNLVHVYSLAVARHALTQRSKSQKVKVTRLRKPSRSHGC